MFDALLALLRLMNRQPGIPKTTRNRTSSGCRGWRFGALLTLTLERPEPQSPNSIALGFTPSPALQHSAKCHSNHFPLCFLNIPGKLRLSLLFYVQGSAVIFGGIGFPRVLGRKASCQGPSNGRCKSEWEMVYTLLMRDAPCQEPEKSIISLGVITNRIPVPSLS